MASGRNVINQSIQLDGGDEVKRKLEELGATGEQAARKLEGAFSNVNFGKGLDAQLSNFRNSFSNFSNQISNVGKSAGNVVKSVQDVGSAFVDTGRKIGVYTLALSGAAAAAGLFIKSSEIGRASCRERVSSPV